MKSATPEPGRWGWGRFLLMVLALFASQAGLVLLFGERGRAASTQDVAHVPLRVLPTPLSGEEMDKYVFANDPTLFAAPSPHGFSERAWGGFPRVKDRGSEQIEPASFLEFAANRLGAVVTPRGTEPEQIPFELTAEQGTTFDFTRVASTGTGQEESFFRIRGALRLRQIVSRVELPVAANLQTNTTVEFGANRAGQVVSARMRDWSGSPEADAKALETVWRLRFVPEPGRAADLVWDVAVFYWKTVEAPAGGGTGTNVVGGAPP